MPTLSDVIKIGRRYYRSVNLERDLMISDSVLGYVPTTKSLAALERVASAYLTPHSIRAWTITGVYGTGKSAFAHILSSLCAPSKEKIKKNALTVLKKSDTSGESLASVIQKKFPKKGLIRAVVTAQREPVANTILRGLGRSSKEYWSGARGAKPQAYRDLNMLIRKLAKGGIAENQEVLTIIKGLAEASHAGLVIIIDELGKNLEFAAQNQSVDDLYLLQQIAELPSGEDDSNIFLIGLLHQSFSDYAHGLTTSQRNEWTKIQGRFEDLPLVDSPEQTIKLIGSSIDQTGIDTKSYKKIRVLSKKWLKALESYGVMKQFTSNNIASVFPLHPISAVTLPILCSRYAQNDRTLFTFLTSTEPQAFQSFLSGSSITKDNFPTLKLYQVYDYFVESAGVSISLRPQFQRWVEIHDRIYEARHLTQDEQSVLKTIGVLNLISASGALKASKDFVALALTDTPTSKKELTYWNKVISSLIAKKHVIWRKQIDELRLWEGTDFDIEKEVANNLHVAKGSLANALNEYCHLSPVVIQRHSYLTGTLRSFERIFVDNTTSETTIREAAINYDGLICYWVGEKYDFYEPLSTTFEGKPIVFLVNSKQKAIQLACHEYVAIEYTYRMSAKLRTDGVARREVGERLVYSKKILDHAVDNTFHFGSRDLTCIFAGSERKVVNRSAFSSALSDLCNEVYYKGPVLWNELINRKELTTQGAKARRMLCGAMLENNGQERLGLTGNGPEVSMLQSLLCKSGIYANVNGHWAFSSPEKSGGLHDVWKAIESFCIESTDTPRSVEELYRVLCLPPYGLRKQVIPVLLLSVLLKHMDDMSLYADGTFVPMIGPEHFELLVKNPSKFAVKYFEIEGVRAMVFEELENIFQKSSIKKPTSSRNATLLSIVKPLITFVKKLPRYTLHTGRLNQSAINVRNTLLNAKEPDLLIFNSLPKALGVPELKANGTEGHTEAKEFRRRLVKALQELQTAYENLISHCKELLHTAFSIRSNKDKLREDLTVRANYLVGQCIEPTLRRFILAATNDVENEQDWLEPLLMIVADKPAENWKDEDILIFESKLSAIARKFINLEALQKGMAKSPGGGFTALRVTITKADGHEINRLVWKDNDKKEKVDALLKEFLEWKNISTDKEMQHALIAALVEKVATKESKYEIPELRIKKGEKKVG